MLREIEGCPLCSQTEEQQSFTVEARYVPRTAAAFVRLFIDQQMPATEHIIHLEQENSQLQQSLAAFTAEVARLRDPNEKFSFGVDDAPSPGQVSPDSRPRSPPPEGAQPQSSNIPQPFTESSSSASKNRC